MKEKIQKINIYWLKMGYKVKTHSVHSAFREATTRSCQALLKVFRERENGKLEKSSQGCIWGGLDTSTQMEKKKTELQETYKACIHILTPY